MLHRKYEAAIKAVVHIVFSVCVIVIAFPVVIIILPYSYRRSDNATQLCPRVHTLRRRSDARAGALLFPALVTTRQDGHCQSLVPAYHFYVLCSRQWPGPGRWPGPRRWPLGLAQTQMGLGLGLAHAQTSLGLGLAQTEMGLGLVQA